MNESMLVAIASGFDEGRMEVDFMLTSEVPYHSSFQAEARRLRRRMKNVQRTTTAQAALRNYRR